MRPAAAGSTLRPFALADAIGSLAWPRSLVSTDARDAAVAFTEGLPPVFHWGVLEARLTGDDPRVDVLASITDGPGSREDLATVLAEPVDQRLSGARPLLSAWARREAPPLDDVHVIWLEWDAPLDPTAVPLQLPSIDPRFWGAPDAVAATPAYAAAIAATTYAAAYGRPHRAEVLSSIERLVACLPPGARALATATLEPRGHRVDRLFVGIPRVRVLEWLDAIGWPGDRDLVARWLPRVVAPWEPAFLQVEVGPEVTPYLGIEPCQTNGGVCELRERRWFLEHLVASGLTTDERIAAVLAWEGRAEAGDAEEVRSLHLKCVLTADRAPEVKAYLGFHYE